MKYLFTLLATCFVLGLSAQSADSASKITTDHIEVVKQDLASQNSILSQNEELTEKGKMDLAEKLSLTDAQITKITNDLVDNSNAIVALNNSSIEPLEKKERMSALEAERSSIIYQALTPVQQSAFKSARN